MSKVFLLILMETEVRRVHAAHRRNSNSPSSITDTGNPLKKLHGKIPRRLFDGEVPDEVDWNASVWRLPRFLLSLSGRPSSV